MGECWIFISSSLSRRQHWPHGYVTDTRTTRSCGGRRAAAERESEREREAEMRDDGPRPDRLRRAAAGLAAVYIISLKLLACAAAHCHAKWRGR